MPPASEHSRAKSEFLDKPVMETKEVEDTKVEEFQPQQEFTRAQLLLARSAYLAVIIGCYWKADSIQEVINSSWFYLREQWWFQTVYFETILSMVYLLGLRITFQTFDKIRYLDKFKVTKSAGKDVADLLSNHAIHFLEYVLTIGAIDTFHVNHYYGVSDEVIRKKKQSWIQVTRALPEFAPKFHEVVFHILVAIVIFDALFFTMLYGLHKNHTLYQVIHKKHHSFCQGVINTNVTDYNHWLERVVIVLCANAGLNVQGAHPFTRMIYVLVYVGFLMYSHGGYDFPWMPDRVVPGGIINGARKHYAHHATGKRNYQFILTYLDNSLEKWSQKKKAN